MYRKRTTLRAALCLALAAILALGSVPTLAWAELVDVANDALVTLTDSLDTEGEKDGEEPANESEQGSESVEKDGEEPGDPDDVVEPEEEPATETEGEPEAMALDGAEGDPQDGAREQAEPRAGSVINSGADLQAAIEAEGGSLPDPNFAQAIFDSIIADGGANLTDGSTVAGDQITLAGDAVAMLEEYNGAVSGSSKGIRDITGIKYLKRSKTIDLTDNQIMDLKPLAFEQSNATDNYWSGTVQGRPKSVYVYLAGNPLIAVVSNIGGMLILDQIFGTDINFPTQLPHLALSLVSDGKGTAERDLKMTLPWYYEGQNEMRVNTLQHGVWDGVTVWPIDKDYIADGTITNGSLLSSFNISEDETGSYGLVYGTYDNMRFYNGSTQKKTPFWGMPIDITIYNSLTFTSDQTTVGSATVKKTAEGDSGQQEPLEGAWFKLYKKTDAGDVLVENKKTQDQTSDARKGAFRTGADGLASVDGLEPGSYYWIETEAPAGYVLDPSPIEFTINQGSFSVDEKSGAGTKSLTEQTGVTGWTCYDLDGEVTDPAQDGSRPIASIEPVVENGDTFTLDGNAVYFPGGTGPVADFYIDLPTGVTLKNIWMSWTQDDGSYTEPIAFGSADAARAKVQELQREYRNIRVTNTYKVANLRFKKTVQGDTQGDAFDFTVTVGEKPYSGPYTVEGDGAPAGEQTATDGKVTGIKDGWTVTIPDVLVGAEWKVQEAADGSYVGQTFVDGSALDADEGDPAGTLASGTMGEGGAQAGFLNVKRTGELTVEKAFSTGADQDQDFTFTLTLDGKPAPDGTAYTVYTKGAGGTYPSAGDDATITSGNGTFTLKAGQKAVFTLEDGLAYAVTETTASNFLPGVSTGAPTGTVDWANPSSASFSNYVKEPVLQLTKAMDGDDTDAFTYLVEVSIDGGKSYQSYQGDDVVISGPLREQTEHQIGNGVDVTGEKIAEVTDGKIEEIRPGEVAYLPLSADGATSD